MMNLFDYIKYQSIDLGSAADVEILPDEIIKLLFDTMLGTYQTSVCSTRQQYVSWINHWAWVDTCKLSQHNPISLIYKSVLHEYYMKNNTDELV